MVTTVLSLVVLVVEEILSVKSLRPFLLSAIAAVILWFVASRFAQKIDNIHDFDDWVAAITFAVLLPVGMTLSFIHLTALTNHISWQWIAVEALVMAGGLVHGATAAARQPADTL